VEWSWGGKWTCGGSVVESRDVEVGTGGVAQDNDPSLLRIPTQHLLPRLAIGIGTCDFVTIVIDKRVLRRKERKIEKKQQVRECEELTRKKKKWRAYKGRLLAGIGVRINVIAAEGGGEEEAIVRAVVGAVSFGGAEMAYQSRPLQSAPLKVSMNWEW